MSIKEEWRDFFIQEKGFYDHLLAYNLIRTFDGCVPEFETKVLPSGKQIPYPPQYIRQIYKVTSRELHALKLHWEGVEDTWRKRMDESGMSTKRRPPRFPHFIEEVEHIHVSKHDSYSSKLLDGEGTIPIARYRFSDKAFAEEDRMRLDELGIKSELQNKVNSTSRETGTPDIYLLGNQRGILNYFDLENVRCRRPSGHQYRAKVAFEGKPKSEGKRYNLGLLICTGTFPVVSYKKPTESRKHKTEIVKDSLEFGCHLHGKFVNFFNDDE